MAWFLSEMLSPLNRSEWFFLLKNKPIVQPPIHHFLYDMLRHMYLTEKTVPSRGTVLVTVTFRTHDGELFSLRHCSSFCKYSYSALFEAFWQTSLQVPLRRLHIIPSNYALCASFQQLFLILYKSAQEFPLAGHQGRHSGRLRSRVAVMIARFVVLSTLPAPSRMHNSVRH